MAPSEFYREFPLMIQSMLYGIFFSLVCLCLHVLRTPRRSNYMQVGVVLLLFALDTIHMVLSYVIQFRRDPNSAEAEIDRAYLNFSIALDQPRPSALLAFHRVVFILLSLCSEVILIHRAWIVWGTKLALLLPYLSTILAIVLGGLQFSPSARVRAAGTLAFFSLTFLRNIACNSATAGRIWWINHNARKHCNFRASNIPRPTSRNPYQTIIIMIIESGILYPLSIITLLIISALSHAHGYQDVPAAAAICVAIMYQVIGIAPALVLVRVGLGVSIENVQASMTSFRAEAPHNISLRSQLTTVNIDLGNTTGRLSSKSSHTGTAEESMDETVV